MTTSTALSIGPAALPQQSARDEDFEPDPPSAAEIELDQEVAYISGTLASVAGRRNQSDAAWALNLAHDLFETLRRKNRTPPHLNARQRDDLLEGLASARLGAELHFFGEDRGIIIDGIRAFQALAVHFGRSPDRRTIPSDRLADLIAHLRIGHNAVRNIELRAGLAEREQTRALSALEFAERLSP